MKTPKLILHGGAGNGEMPPSRPQKIHESFLRILHDSYPILLSQGASAGVVHAIKMLEDDPLFNAGTGSCLQLDGQIRMTAALMNAKTQRFSGVINIQNVQNPIQVATLLQQEKNTVLAGPLATQYAHAKGIPLYNPLTPERKAEFEARQQPNPVTTPQTTFSEKDTVGAVAIDQEGNIVAACSTGGIGNEIPGRVSDCATVAGTYASLKAGVSCTGIGEEIVNYALAAKVVTRVEEGMPLREAVEKSLAEGRQLQYSYGLIALDSQGNLYWGKTTRHFVYGYANGTQFCTFLPNEKSLKPLNLFMGMKATSKITDLS